jgi:hypothetical protein
MPQEKIIVSVGPSCCSNFCLAGPNEFLFEARGIYFRTPCRMMQVFYVQTALNFLLDLKKQNLHVVKDKKFVAMYTKVQMPQKNHKNM